MASAHEEADTKLIALVHAANLPPGNAVMIRSPSGDIDTLALFVAHDFGGVQVLVDNGSGKSRKIIDVTSTTLDSNKKKALIGLHAFSGNDYISSFFRIGKVAVRKAMLKKDEFINLFAYLGSSFQIPEDSMKGLEKFVCALYRNQRISSVNEMCYNIFVQKFEKEKKIIDLSLLPPCQTNLELHIKRANYVAAIYRQADHLNLALEDPRNHGWDDKGNVVWSNICYPEDISELLFDRNEANDDESDFEASSDFEDVFDDDIDSDTDFY